jgi:hypothetical protein
MAIFPFTSIFPVKVTPVPAENIVPDSNALFAAVILPLTFAPFARFTFPPLKM